METCLLRRPVRRAVDMPGCRVYNGRMLPSHSHRMALLKNGCALCLYLATAPAMAGPRSEFKDIAPPATKTYDSQTAFILPVFGSKTTSYVYVGDRWKPNNLADSRYVWLPLTIGSGTMSLTPDHPWTIDAAMGVAAASTP